MGKLFPGNNVHYLRNFPAVGCIVHRHKLCNTVLFVLRIKMLAQKCEFQSSLPFGAPAFLLFGSYLLVPCASPKSANPFSDCFNEIKPTHNIQPLLFILNCDDRMVCELDVAKYLYSLDKSKTKGKTHKLKQVHKNNA